MKNNYRGLKIFIFIFGLIVIALSSVLTGNIFAEKKGEFFFSAVCVALIYTVAFVPIFLSGFTKKIAIAAASAAVYYKGVSVYALATVADIVLAMTRIPLGAAIAIECTALFVFAVYVLLTCFTFGHLSNTDRAEKAKLSGITRLREKSAQLAATVSSVSATNRNFSDAVAKIAENMRYLSPNDSPEAYELENYMCTVLDMMLSDDYLRSGGMNGAEPFEAKLRDFDALYRQRKSLL